MCDCLYDKPKKKNAAGEDMDWLELEQEVESLQVNTSEDVPDSGPDSDFGESGKECVT